MAAQPDDINALKGRIHELEEIHRLAQSLSAFTSQVEMLESISDCCLRLCHADKAAILLLHDSLTDPASTVVRSATTQHGSIPHVLNSLVAGWMLKHRSLLDTDDLPRDLNFRGRTAEREDAGPALAVPMVVDGELIGIMHLIRGRSSPRFSPDEVRIAQSIAPLASQSIRRGHMHEALKEEARTLRLELQKYPDAGLLVGESPAIAAVRTMITRIAPTTATVLLIGETGTGKELVARAIHYQSHRAHKPFVAVNCAAIPDTLFESELFGHERGSFTGASGTQTGKFEQADGGTLFLDEISSLPLDLQPKLLRVLENRRVTRIGSADERSIDVRLIAASETDLRTAVERQEFRNDLYHRLNVVPIPLPPLRSRREDIPALAQHFLRELSLQKATFSDDALAYLQNLPWKGNVRELRNVVERASLFIDAPTIGANDLRVLGLEQAVDDSRDLTAHLLSFLRLRHDGTDLPEEMDKMLVTLALRESQGNISRASKVLGIDRTALQRRIKKYGIELHQQPQENAADA